MRLIDADKIESKLTYEEFDRDEKVGWIEAYRHFMKMIEDAPTAYDVDKVVEQLKKNSMAFMGDKNDRDVDLDEAIKIVKAEIEG